MKKNREIWESLVPEYQGKMMEGFKQVVNNHAVIEEAKSESEEDSGTSNNISSVDNSSVDYSITEMNEEQKEGKIRKSNTDVMRFSKSSV